jgi:type 1 fimbriae regulatory protein FimB
VVPLKGRSPLCGGDLGLGLKRPPYPFSPILTCCGFALAEQGADTRLIQDYLGHRNIQHTAKYIASNPTRFEKLWR